MYTKDGIQHRSVIRRADDKLIPWDSVRACKVGGQQVVRHTLVLKAEHFPIFVMGNGIGGFFRRDAGRTLIVDKLPDGRWIDYLT